MDTVTRLVAVRLMQRELAAMERDLKAKLATELVPGDRKQAALQLNGQTLPVGGVTFKKAGSPRPAVTDPQQATGWARGNLPALVQQRVNPSKVRNPELVDLVRHELPEYVETYIDPAQLLRAVGNPPVDAEGELIPGVELRPGADPSIAFLPADPDQDELLRQAIRQGDIRMADVLAVEAGEPA